MGYEVQRSCLRFRARKACLRKQSIPAMRLGLIVSSLIVQR